MKLRAARYSASFTRRPSLDEMTAEIASCDGDGTKVADEELICKGHVMRDLSSGSRGGDVVRVVGLLAALVTLSTAAHAQTTHLGTPEEQKACAADARRHCRAVLDNGDMAVLACLQQHHAKLSQACRTVLKGQRGE